MKIAGEPGPGKMRIGPGPRKQQLGQVSTTAAVLPEAFVQEKRERGRERETMRRARVCLSKWVCM